MDYERGEFEFGEPWAVRVHASTWGRSPDVVDASGCEVCHVYGLDHNPALARITACVNLLAGIPTARLSTPDPATLMFLAYLRGDVVAALAYADEIQAEVNRPEGFVSREDLKARLAACQRELAASDKNFVH